MQRATKVSFLQMTLRNFLALQNDLLRPINFHAKVGDEQEFCKKDERRFCTLRLNFTFELTRVFVTLSKNGLLLEDAGMF